MWGGMEMKEPEAARWASCSWLGGWEFVLSGPFESFMEGSDLTCLVKEAVSA